MSPDFAGGASACRCCLRDLLAAQGWRAVGACVGCDMTAGFSFVSLVFKHYLPAALPPAAVAVGVVGVGVALAGLGLAALPGATLGVLGGAAVSNSFARRPKPPLRPEEVRRDEEGRLENWGQLLRAVQHGVRLSGWLYLAWVRFGWLHRPGRLSLGK